MYCRFFELRRNPFGLSTKLDCDYLPTNHQLVLNQLVNNLEEKIDVLCLLGPEGVGKTTLIKQMVKDVENQSCIFIFLNLNSSASDQLSILVPNTVTRTKESISTGGLQDSINQHPSIVLVLDQADSANDEFLLELFAAITRHKIEKNPVRLILVGSLEFDARLNSPKFAPYQSLLIETYALGRLGHREVKNYILYRLRFAEYAGKTLFCDEAIQLIAQLSKGIPRTINALCENSLIEASLNQLDCITEETVNSAAELSLLEKDIIKPLEVSTEILPVTSDSLTDEVLKLPDAFVAQSLEQVAQMLGEYGQTKDLVNPTPDISTESKQEQQSVTENKLPVTKPVEPATDAPVSPENTLHDDLTLQEATDGKPKQMLESADNAGEIIQNASNQSNKNSRLIYQVIFAVVVVLVLIAAIIWIVEQQTTNPNGYDVTDKNTEIKTEAHGDKTRAFPLEEESRKAEVANTSDNQPDLVEIEIEYMQGSVPLTRSEQSASATTPDVAGVTDSLEEEKKGKLHRQEIEAVEKNVFNNNVSILLAKALKQENSNHLTQPKGDNAAETYRDLLKIDPDNTDAKQGIHRIKRIFEQQAQRFKDQGQWRKAEAAIVKVLLLDPESTFSLDDIQQRINSSSETATKTTQPSPELPAPDNLLDDHEFATKVRASARFQLVQKGVTFDLKNFVAAAERGDEILLKLFLDAKMPIDAQDDLAMDTALIKAAANGHYNLFLLIMTKTPELNIQNRYGQTALISAATNGHYEILLSLLTLGANVNVTDNKGWDALMNAAATNQVAVIKLLLKFGADKNTTDVAGRTALSVAENYNHNEILKLLKK